MKGDIDLDLRLGLNLVGNLFLKFKKTSELDNLFVFEAKSYEPAALSFIYNKLLSLNLVTF